MDAGSSYSKDGAKPRGSMRKMAVVRFSRY